MNNAPTIEVARKHLFSNDDELAKHFHPLIVQRLLRLREMYLWMVHNPERRDRDFVTELQSRHDISRSQAYDDLKIIKSLLPNMSEATKEFHRWRYNEMILETYAMAKKRKDTKTMEKAATSYAKYNRIDQEDELAIPYDEIVVQPFTPTSDPSVLGIKPIPNLDRKIADLLAKYRAASADIEDIEFEEPDLQEQILFDPPTTPSREPQ